MRLRLELAGHPDYQGGESLLNEPSRMEVVLFENLELKLRKALVDWKKNLKNAYDQHPRLLFLDCKQLPKLMNKLSDIIKSETEIGTDIIYKLLFPYVSCCFPEYSMKFNGNTLFTNEVLLSSYETSYQRNKQELDTAEGIVIKKVLLFIFV